MFGDAPPTFNQTMSRHDVSWIPTVTIYSKEVPPPFKHVWARTPHLSIKHCLDMTSFGNVELLFIAMTYVGMAEGYLQLLK